MDNRELLSTIIGTLNDYLSPCEAIYHAACEVYAKQFDYNDRCRLTGLPPHVDQDQELAAFQRAVKDYNLARAIRYTEFVRDNLAVLRMGDEGATDNWEEGMNCSEETVDKVISTLARS